MGLEMVQQSVFNRDFIGGCVIHHLLEVSSAMEDSYQAFTCLSCSIAFRSAEDQRVSSFYSLVH
jgi:hypothetical protein